MDVIVSKMNKCVSTSNDFKFIFSSKTFSPCFILELLSLEGRCEKNDSINKGARTRITSLLPSPVASTHVSHPSPAHVSRPSPADVSRPSCLTPSNNCNKSWHLLFRLTSVRQNPIAVTIFVKIEALRKLVVEAVLKTRFVAKTRSYSDCSLPLRQRDLSPDPK